MSKTKVAVLGGGCGAMAAVWGLLQSKDADKYDITVYQMGWRIGGKGASGRNAEFNQRIEEHGLHIWMGMYENAFGMMRKVYDDLGRPPDAPLSTWFDPGAPLRSAFLPQNFVTLTEFYDGRWQTWNLEVPSNRQLPGTGTEFPSLISYVRMALQFMLELFIGADHLWILESFLSPFSSTALRRWLTPVVKSVEDVLRVYPCFSGLEQLAHSFTKNSGAAFLEAALAAAELLPSDPEQHTPAQYAAIFSPLDLFMAGMRARFEHLLDKHTELRRTFIILNYAYALVRGLIKDDIIKNGFDYIDDQEFMAWLTRHGAAPITLSSPLVRGWYDLVFAYEKGDPGRPSLSAGVAVRTLMRAILTYKGAFFWEMQAGMGDTIFAPIYEVMRRRGVKFKFFHKVEQLSIMSGAVATDEIQSIRIGQQVDLKTPGAEYHPLVDVKGLPCWPSEPLYDQIEPVQAALLQAGHINLESSWTPWTPVKTFDLKKGVDFDIVILGISIGALPAIAAELGAHHAPFQLMMDNIKTVQTQSSQIWLTPTMTSLGWHHPPTVASGYAQSLNTWADLSHLIPREDWGGVGHPPRSLIYLTGIMSDAREIPPPSDHRFPATQQQRVWESTATWLAGNSAPMWPRAALEGSPELDWRLLVTAHGDPPGDQRLYQQYWRANIDPTERYVMSLPGTARYRLRADQSGYKNLFLAGDWLKTGINAGCVEAAVMGGFQASQAISGWPETIIGDSDFPFDPGVEHT